MARMLEELEAEALDLSEEDRTTLFERLLRSFDSHEDGEIAHAWAEEALRRDEAMESGEEPGVPEEATFKRLRSTLRMGRDRLIPLARQELNAILKPVTKNP